MDGVLDLTKFAEELQFCINQLELGLQRQSPDSRQAEETIKVLKILRSSKAPIVKKRQVMRNALGDYRKKMRDAEKKSLSGLKHSRFQPFGSNKAPTSSRFLKMSHNKQHNSNDMNKKLQNLHLLSSKQGPCSSSTSEAAACVSSLLDDLVHQAYHDSVNFPFNSIGPHSTVGSNVLDGCSDQELQCSSMNQNHHLPSSPFSSSSSSSHRGSNARKADIFKYQPSDNSFVFGFESPVTDPDGDRQMIVDDDLRQPQDQEMKQTGSSKVVANVYKYEKSINDFSFNFGEPGDE